MKRAESTLLVNEIFFSIQGESTFAGRPCVFVRLTGCGLRCEWCDTAYAFYEGAEHSVDDVITAVRAFNAPLVELTGGEPLEQVAAFPLMSRLCDLGYEVLVETGGHVDVSAVDARVRKIVDVKCPGSGMEHRNRWENIPLLTARDEVKFVIANRLDYEWAVRTLRHHAIADRCGAVHFSPVHDELAPIELAQWILEDRLPVRLQLQVHKFIWSPEMRGV